MARDPTMVPTAMPAMSPLDKPPEELDDAAVAVTVVEAAVLVAPESKPSAVTLKQGTERLKSVVSTKYCDCVC